MKAIKSYIVGFVWATCLVMIAYFSAKCFNSFHLLNGFYIELLQTFSLVPGAAALYGHLGWEIQTWDGNSAEEIWNQRLFRVISSIGFFLAVWSFLLK